MNEQQNWYAIKIYTAKPEITKYLKDSGTGTFVPMLNNRPLMRNLIFLHCTLKFVKALKAAWFFQLMVYQNGERTAPRAIPEKEMENFRMVLDIKNNNFIPLEINDRNFLLGEKVRVLDGPLKGAEGIIRRIKGDRRLIVSITGIAAVATVYVSPAFLEKV